MGKKCIVYLAAPGGKLEFATSDAALVRQVRACMRKHMRRRKLTVAQHKRDLKTSPVHVTTEIR